MARDFDRRAQRLNVNLRQSVSAARNLSFAMADFSGKLGGAVNAAANLAENIARVSKNARIAASATGIGAVVAVLATVGVGIINWRERTKEVAKEVQHIRREMAIINAKGAGDVRLARELEIAESMERELDAAKELESIFRRFPQLQDAIRQKAEAARRAALQETERAFGDALFELDVPGLPSRGSDAQRRRAEGERDIKRRRDERLRELDRNEKGFNADQRDQIKNAIQIQFENDMRDLAFDLEAPARAFGDAIGRTIAGSIADGISTAVAEGSIGEGLRALTGGMLMGLGDLMIEIGTQSLLAAQLFAGVVNALRSFAPEGAIGPALALIAGGAVLRGIGASMGGSSGRGGRSGGSGGGGFSSGTTIIDRGLVNPLNGVVNAPGFITPRQSVVNNWTVIGENDPVAQRMIVRLVDKGLSKSGRSI